MLYISLFVSVNYGCITCTTLKIYCPILRNLMWILNIAKRGIKILLWPHSITKLCYTDISILEHLLNNKFTSTWSIYVTWMYLVFMYIVPFSCLAIFNLLIFLAIRRASVQRALLTTQEKKDHNLASMFLVVVLVFFICNSLSLIVNILEV